MMIDLHAHILPGVDDGADDLEVSLEMAAMAAESGVSILVATPHSNQIGRFENFYDEKLSAKFRALKSEVKKHGIPLEILEGMEIFASEDMGIKIKKGFLRGINRSDYYLVEFPFEADPWWIGQCLEGIFDQGKIPLIAHPERYFCVQDYPGLVYEWLQSGCLIQMNKGSILGRFGREVRDAAETLLLYDLISCVASDAHSFDMRTPHMGLVREHLEQNGGSAYARHVLYENPRLILSNRRIAVHGVRPEIKRKYL